MRTRFLFILILIGLGIGNVAAQKKLLTYSSSKHWPSIDQPSISNDGRFIKYTIRVPDSGSKFIVQATRGNWKKELSGVSYNSFTGDSRRLVFMNSKDSLGIWDLGTAHIRYISEVGAFSAPEEGNSPYITYQKKGTEKMLTLLNLATGEEKNFTNVSDYMFNNNGTVLLIAIAKNSSFRENVLWLNLESHGMNMICQCGQAGEFAFNDSGTRLVFSTKESTNGRTVKSLLYYKSGMDTAQIIVGPGVKGMSGISICGDAWLRFSKLGNELFFSTEDSDSLIPTQEIVNVNAHVSILGIHDMERRYELEKGTFPAAINLNDVESGVVRLQQERDKGRNWFPDDYGDWVITESNIDLQGDDVRGLAVEARPDIYLVSTKSGVRRLIQKGLLYYGMVFSPSGKYVVWFDRVRKQWFSYNISENRTRNIAGLIKEPLYDEDDHPDYPRAQIAGWLENGNSVLIYGRNDIWQVDPDGSRPPVNLTRRSVEKDSIRFRLVNFQKDRTTPFTDKDTLLLSAFDLNNKDDGYFRLILGSGKLEKLVMGPEMFTKITDVFDGAANAMRPMKAKDANAWVLVHMSANEYPNLYITHDFRQFVPITTLAPQKTYNWYRSELIHWTLPDKKTAEGLLYKPEDFDPKKKYPVIFYYYEKNAYNLNIFINPDYANGELNIPWFVSNGYIVCVPDIYYKIGHPMKSACESVTSAALYLSKMPWVDSRRMGLQGHSYAGEETNYIVSHSSLFAAAAPASGDTNLISSYGQEGLQGFFERRQGRIGATLWQRPDLYIENSAVLSANKITAPVLIMHTTGDWPCPYAHALEWYYCLRRLDKKVWLLSYDGNHVLYDRNDQLDYSIRLGQFFDHYLKGLAPPKWMTEGGTSLDLDTSGKQP